MPCRIELSEIELMLQIGCQEDERAIPQPVRLRAAVRSDETFPACWSDELRDTIDAAMVKSVVVETALAARVKTLERLAQLVERELRARFSARRCDWELVVSKPKFGWSYVHTWST